MTPVASRIVRGALLAVLLAVVVSVALTIKKRPVDPAPSPTPSAAAPQASPTPLPQVPEVNQVEYRRVIGSKEAFVLRALQMLGKEQEEVRLRGVNMDFNYVRLGQPGKGTITADECTFVEAINKAVFRGNVVVTGQDGAELRTTTLVYRGDKQLARTDEPVAFKRKAFSGTAVGMDYAAAEERIEFHSDVAIRIDDPDDPLTLITAGKAFLDRANGQLRLAGNVVVRRPGETLTSQRLVADLTPEQTISRAEAEGDVVLDTAATAPGAQPTPGVGGGRHLTAKRLDIVFENGVMKQAAAGPDADLTMLPGPKEPDKRRLQARFINFSFDPQGQLQELQGQRDVVFRVEGKEPREVRSHQLVATMAPGSGEMQEVQFTRDVTLVQGKQRGEAETVVWTVKGQTMSLRRKASLADDQSLLEAQQIDATTGGTLTADGRVRHSLKGSPGGDGGLMRGEEGATITSADFAYDPKTRTGRYQGKARVVAGNDIINGETITIAEDAGGSRVLRAEKDVTARFSPRNRAPAGSSQENTPIHAKSAKLVYDETKKQVDFEGAVRLQQGELVTESPTATVLLDESGSGLKTLLAGEPVAVQQGKRKAAGARATYTPAQDTMVITGEKVTLEDPGQQKVEGRSITFHLKDDRIIVDGQERTRTEMRMQRALPSPGAGKPPAGKPSAAPAKPSPAPSPALKTP